MRKSKKSLAAEILNRKEVTPCRQGVWDIDEEKRGWYRDIAQKARVAKLSGNSGVPPEPVHEIYIPRLNPDTLMPGMPANGLNSLSLFSGGGGLDLGFEKAGYGHVASYELLEKVAKNLAANRPSWAVYGGEAGNVTMQDWTRYTGVDVMHGGPPCQPFSNAGRQFGEGDSRDMLPAYVRAIRAVSPAAFILENVPALLGRKFKEHVEDMVMRPLSGAYHIHIFLLDAGVFGVPQVRRRAFFVGFKNHACHLRFIQPQPTHTTLLPLKQRQTFLPVCMGAREALGLPDIGHDALAPTIRSALTGPRYTTSVLAGQAAQKRWAELQIWPNGVSLSRESAQLFPAHNGHFRLSVPDCAVLQGFTEEWHFSAPAYLALGQIGNSVCPPVGYHLAKSIHLALG